MQRWNVITEGALLPAFTQDSVANNLRTGLKLSEPQVQHLLSKNTVIIKKNLTQEQGDKYKAALTKCGLVVYLEDASPAVTVESSSKQASSAIPIAQTALAAGALMDQSAPFVPQVEAASAHNVLLDHPVLTPDPGFAPPDAAFVQYEASLATQESLLAEEPSLLHVDRAEKVEKKRREHVRQSPEQLGYVERFYEDDEETIQEVAPPNFFEFNIEGRYGRLNYINANVIFFISFYIAFPLIAVFLSFISLIFIFPIYLCALFYNFRIMALRFQDINLSGYFALLVVIIDVWHLLGKSSFAALFSMIIMLGLFLVPGSKDENNYGPPSVRGGLWGIWVTVSGLVLAVSIAAYIGQREARIAAIYSAQQPQVEGRYPSFDLDKDQ